MFLNFYQRANKTNIQNNIGGISNFQNELNDLFSSTDVYFKSKVIEGIHKGGDFLFFNFWLFFQNVHFKVVAFFVSCLA